MNICTSLYDRRTSQPTTFGFNCTTSCTIDALAAGTWLDSRRGFSAYSGVSMTVAVVQ